MSLPKESDKVQMKLPRQLDMTTIHNQHSQEMKVKMLPEVLSQAVLKQTL